jgi:hypothetical protein
MTSISSKLTILTAGSLYGFFIMIAVYNNMFLFVSILKKRANIVTFRETAKKMGEKRFQSDHFL